MIKNDEYDILKFIRFFGPLKKEQICLYFGSKLKGDVSRIIHNMCVRGLLSFDQRSFILYPSGRINPDTIDYKMIKAFWVFLRFKDVTEGVYPTEFPSQIFFVKDGLEYEIVVVPRGDERLIASLLTRKRYDEVKYLLVLDSPEQSELINFEGVAAYCTVSAGKVEFYKAEREDDT